MSPESHSHDQKVGGGQALSFPSKRTPGRKEPCAPGGGRCGQETLVLRNSYSMRPYYAQFIFLEVLGEKSLIPFIRYLSTQHPLSTPCGNTAVNHTHQVPAYVETIDKSNNKYSLNLHSLDLFMCIFLRYGLAVLHRQA